MSDRQRFVQAAPAVVSWQPTGSDGEPADPGTVTVGVTSSDGSVVVAAGTATGGTGTAPRTVSLTAGQTAQLDVLTAVWSAAGVVVGRSVAEVVGGVYFTAGELRAAEGLGDVTRTPTALIVGRREEVESSFESWCNVAFVPRFSVVDVAASCWSSRLITGLFEVRAVRWAQVSDGFGNITVVDPSEVVTFPPSPAGFVDRTTGWYGLTVRLGVEHGFDGPPRDVKAAAMTYCRYLLNRPRNSVPDRATAMSSPDGGSFQLARVGTDWRPTGVDVVDEVLRRPEFDHRGVMLA